MYNKFLKNKNFGDVLITNNNKEITLILNKIKKKFFVIDKTVYEKFNFIRKLIKYKNYIILKSGENQKTIKNFNNIINKMFIKKKDKETNLIAIGGGVIGDISGFIASSYYRGINLINIPTTLLAQIDSSIGGKNAINTKEGKNLIGSFKQPKIIILNNNFIQKIKNYNFVSGLSEIIKIAIIKDKKLFNYIEKETKSLINKKTTKVKYIIKKSLFNKLLIVKKDEKEKKNKRIKLNLGHTFAHAIEKYLNYSINHGEAVNMGIFLSINISKEIKKKESFKIKKLIKEINPYIELKILRLNIKKIKEIMIYDKKKIDSKKIKFIIIKKIGKVKTKTLNIKKKNIFKAN